MPRIVFLAIVVVSIAATACGSSSKSTPQSETPTQAASPAATAAQTAGATFGDPFTYCTAIGTIDAPDARYTGVPYPDPIINGLESAIGAPPDQFHGSAAPSVFPWRCSDGKVWACYPGANLPCGKAETSREPSQGLKDFCQQYPDTAPPAAVTGHATIFDWACTAGVPQIRSQVYDVDPRDFITSYWYLISP